MPVVVLVGCAFAALSLLFTTGLRAAPHAPPHSANNPVPSTVDQIDGVWAKRIKLTFTNTAQARDLVNFPLLVVLNSSRIDYAFTQDAGQDIRFVDADGVAVLAHEIERWDESGTSYVWVKVPKIDRLSNTDFIWMYYGNPSAVDSQDPGNVFTDTYRMVYHLEEDPSATGGVIRDSTANGFHGMNQGTAGAQGFIANALEFEGTNQFVNLGTEIAVINEVSAATVSALVRPDTIGGDGGVLGLSGGRGGLPEVNPRVAISRHGSNVEVSSGSLDDGSDLNRVSSTSDPFSEGTWSYVAAVVDYANDEITIYINGVPRVDSSSVDFANSSTPNTNSASCALGSNVDGTSSFFDGLIDEVRVAATARTAEWIAAQYLSMTDAFIAFGGEEDIELPSLGLYAWVSRDEVYAGSRLDYSLLVRNLGGTASQLVVSDTLPAHTTFGGCNCAHAGWLSTAKARLLGAGGCGPSFYCGSEGNEVVWHVEEMKTGRLLQMTFQVTVDTGLADGTVIVNDSYAIAADRFAPLVIFQPVTTTVRETLVLVTGNASPNPVTVGQRLQFTITVRNDGRLLQSVMVTDRLPTGVSFLDCGGALCELGHDKPEVRWWLSDLPNESERQVTLRVSVDSAAGGTLINELYGAWIPAAGRSVMGDPITVSVAPAPSRQYTINLPLVMRDHIQAIFTYPQDGELVAASQRSMAVLAPGTPLPDCNRCDPIYPRVHSHTR